MDGILGLGLVIVIVVALGIAGRSRDGKPPSAARFVLRFVVALVLVAAGAALLLFGACTIMLGVMSGGGCINC